MSSSPHVLILAGPNGAGKSTAQPFLVPPTMAFVNADNIARELRDAGTHVAQRQTSPQDASS